MFVELPQKEYNALKSYLQQYHYQYEASDCTIEGDATPFVHLEFTVELTKEQAEAIQEQIRKISEEYARKYGPIAENPDRDLDGNGLSDYQEMLMEEEEDNRPRQKPKTKKADVTYNPITQAKLYFTGQAEEEVER